MGSQVYWESYFAMLRVIQEGYGIEESSRSTYETLMHMLKSATSKNKSVTYLR